MKNQTNKADKRNTHPDPFIAECDAMIVYAYSVMTDDTSAVRSPDRNWEFTQPHNDESSLGVQFTDELYL